MNKQNKLGTPDIENKLMVTKRGKSMGKKEGKKISLWQFMENMLQGLRLEATRPHRMVLPQSRPGITVAKSEWYFGGLAKWSDGRYSLKVAPTRRCYGISAKSEVKDALTIHMILIQLKIFLTTVT